MPEDVLKTISEGIRGSNSNTVIFIRGHQFSNRLSSNFAKQTRWYRGLTDYGFRGRLMSFLWQPTWLDFLPCYRDANVEESAYNLWNLLADDDTPPHETISLVGYSMGGKIVQHLLREARRQGIRFRRAYLFGAAADRGAQWSQLLDGVSERLYNFYSTEDDVLEDWCPRGVGLHGLPAYYDRTHDHDCSHFITSHDEWRDSLPRCLRRARVTPSRI